MKAVSDRPAGLARWREWDRRHLWHPYTRFSALDEGLPMIVRGAGPYLYDAEGRAWLDAISSWWACALGHGHPRVVAAIQRQAGTLQHSILGNLSHPGAAELAARLAGWMPDDRRHVHFAGDGASAVEAALKIALQYAANRGDPARTELAALDGAYHGDTLGAVGVGFLDAFHRPYRAVVRPARTLPVPRRAEDEPAARAAAEALFAEHGRRIAALIAEPLMQGAAGMRLYSPGYLRFLFELCRRHGALFIADEIATGFGRTGRRFAFEAARIDPDLVCVGKALTAGYLPLSAVIARDEVYATFDDRPADHSFYHGHTFSGNPLAVAAALAALAVYEEERLWERAATAGARLLARVRAGVAELPAVRETRGLGLMTAVDLDPADGRMVRVRNALLARGLLARPLGPVVYLMPPLNCPDETLDRMADDLAAAVRAAG